MKLIQDKSRQSIKGSSLIMVLLVVLVLSVVGTAVLAASVNNIRVSTKMADYETEYYSAESGVQYAIDFIKKQVSEYYMDMYRSASKSEYITKYNVFYTQIMQSSITTSAACEFTEPVFADASLNGRIQTVITTDAALGSEPVGPVTFIIQSTITIHDVTRTVYGQLTIDKAPIVWIETSSPAIVEAAIVSGGGLSVDANHRENGMIVNGDVITAGTWYSEFESTMIRGNSYIQNDPRALEMLTWKLEFGKFAPYYSMPSLSRLQGIDRTYVTPAPSGSEPPQVVPDADMFFDEDTELSPDNLDGDDDGDDDDDDDDEKNNKNNKNKNKKDDDDDNDDILMNRNIYCDGTLTLSDFSRIENCHITAEGSVIIDDDVDLVNVTIYASGNVDVECESIINTSYHLIQAQGGVSIDCEDDIQYVTIQTLGGNIHIESAEDITDSYMYSSSSIILDDVDRLTRSFLKAGSRIDLEESSIEDTLMYARGDVEIDECDLDNVRVYSSADITLEGNGYPVQNSILCAADQLNIRSIRMSNCYNFAGEDVFIDMYSRNNKSALQNSIFYAEDSIYYRDSQGSNNKNTYNVLLYTNGDIIYDGAGGNTNASPNSAHYNRLQLMAKGEIYSDESGSDGQDWFLITEPVDISSLVGDAGTAADGSSVMADVLYSIGFEQKLDPEDIVKILPDYVKVFIAQSVTE